MVSDTRSTNGVMSADETEAEVLPAVVRSRPDGSERFICYADDVTAADVDDQWLSVDADVPVSVLMMR